MMIEDAKLYDPLVRRLIALDCKSPNDRDLLLACLLDLKKMDRGEIVAHEGDPRRSAYFVLSGWAALCSDGLDGRRRITTLLLPGECSGIACTESGKWDSSFIALTDCEVAFASVSDLRAATEKSVSLKRFFHRAVSQDLAVSRRWLTRDGKGNAFRALCHLLSELHSRAILAGVGDEAYFSLPLSQENIGEATGLTSVHVNRTLKRIRETGAVTVKKHGVWIHDLPYLHRCGAFDPSYLPALA